LRIVRIVLSLVFVGLFLGAPSDSISLSAGVTAALTLFASANAAFSALGLVARRRRSLGRHANGIQLAADVLAALMAVLLLDPVATPLAWTALLLPVLDAATAFGGAAAAGVWIGLGLTYAGLRFQILPDVEGAAALPLIVQQLAAVAVFALPMAFLAARLRDDVDQVRRTLTVAERRAGDLALVAAAAKELDATSDRGYILELAVRFSGALGFERVEILERVEGTGWRLRTASGRGAAQIPHHRERLDSVVSEDTVRTADLASPVAVQQDLHLLGFGTEVTLPLWHGEQGAGVLRALSVEAMTDGDSPVEALKLLASQVAGAWRNATTLEDLTAWSRQLQHDATHDHLTGLPNRAHLLTTIESRLLTLKRPGSDFAVLFLDLDGFKSVNDKMGHEAGDVLLQAVAGRLRHAVRPGDLVARLAGDEFVVVADCPPSHDAATAIARRISACLSAPFAVDGSVVSVRASVGVAHAAPADTVEGILRVADHAMYDAKRLGRGFVVAGAVETSTPGGSV
jgi:diguanylate cyclase (GGDEF)-like protein